MIQRFHDADLQFDVPVDAHTPEGFRRWIASDNFPQGVRASLIEGKVVIDMSPERIDTHAKVKAEIYRVLLSLVADRDLGDFLPDRVYFANERAEISTEPDGIFLSWQRYERGLVQIVTPEDSAPDAGWEIEGSPDWILEIVSPSSVRKDLFTLPEQYHRAGVEELWLIDARQEPIRFSILRWTEGGYEPMKEQDGWTGSPVFGGRFRLERRRDRRGGWQYRLDRRED